MAPNCMVEGFFFLCDVAESIVTQIGLSLSKPTSELFHQFSVFCFTVSPGVCFV